MKCSPLREKLLGASFALALPGLLWSNEPENRTTPLANATLAPELAAAAARENIRVFHTDGVSDVASRSDAIAIWIATAEAGERKQWLVVLERGVATAKEREAHRPKKSTRYLPWGSSVVFESEADAIDLWIAGPVAAHPQNPSATRPASAPKIRRTRVYLPKTILQMGLDDTVRAQRFIHRRIDEIKRDDPTFNADHIFTLHKPLPPETIDWAKPRAERMGMTPEIERTWVGGWVALQSLYECLEDQADLRKIVEIAFDKPPVWRLAKMAFGTVFHMGIDGVNSSSLDPARAGLPPLTLECFQTPFLFSFDKKAVVQGVLVVTQPKPPLDLSAGIIGALAIHPKDGTRMVQASVISVLRGSSSEAPAAASVE